MQDNKHCMQYTGHHAPCTALISLQINNVVYKNYQGGYDVMKIKHKNSSVAIEIFIVALIALCMIILINISDQKIDEVLGTRDSIILRKNPDDTIDEILAKEIKMFRTNACTMVEAYDENFKLVLEMPFDETHVHSDLRNFQALQDLFKKYEEGHTRIIINDEEEDIYFRWTANDKGESRLVIMYMSRPVVKHLWLIPFLCYVILILIFALLVRFRLSQQNDRIHHYQDTTKSVQTSILK